MNKAAAPSAAGVGVPKSPPPPGAQPKSKTKATLGDRSSSPIVVGGAQAPKVFGPRDPISGGHVPDLPGVTPHDQASGSLPPPPGLSAPAEPTDSAGAIAAAMKEQTKAQ